MAVWFFHRGAVFSKEIRNVLLISIDTCRADYLSCYGYHKKTSPNIDAIADEGILFENTYSPVPLTLPAHSSMMTGTIPPYHGIHDNLGYQLDDSNLTLAEILKEEGFNTAAVISAFILDSQFGIDQGFDTYDDDFVNEYNPTGTSQRRGEEVSSHAMEWLDKNQKKPFFLFLHYYDPHAPYDPPDIYKPQNISVDLENAEIARKFYAGEITYVDHCIGQVIDKLKALGIYDSTLIIITGDHGEAIGDHGEKTHGYFIYDESLKVPLIIKIPGSKNSKRIKDNVGLIDLVPTVCSLLGISLNEPVHGVDLSGYFDDPTKRIKKRVLYCESMNPTKYNCNSLLGLVDGGWKYIQTTRPELYNLLEDPQESKNVIEKETHRARILQDQLRQILEQQVRKVGSGGRLELDEESKKRLESLGYIANDSVVEEYDFDQSKDDPKDLIQFHNNNSKLISYIHVGRITEAEELCSMMLKERPDWAVGYCQMGKIATAKEDLKTAIDHYLKALQFDTDRFEIYDILGGLFSQTDDFEKAIVHFNKSLKLNPYKADSYYKIGVAYSHLGKLDEAVYNWQNAIKLDYNDKAIVHENIADALIFQGKIENAITHWKESLKINPDNINVKINLAKALVKKGQLEVALVQLKDSFILDPDQPMVCNMIAEILYTQGRIPDAIEYWKKGLELKPEWPVVLNNLAWILATHKDDNIRNPVEAMKYAQKACELTNYKSHESLDTLSAALASAGKFEEAVTKAEEALKISVSLGLQKKTDQVKKRIELYRLGRPYRE